MAINNAKELKFRTCHNLAAINLNMNLNFNEFDTPLTGLFSDKKLQ